MMQATMNISKLENDNEILQIVKLAKPIWLEHYSAIIGEQQVLYMLEKFQSFDAIKKQLAEHYQYFSVFLDDKLIGYFSIQSRENSSLFISKFYLSKEARGQGIGKLMLTYIDGIAIQQHCKTIDLTVNKNNPAYKVYLQLGFLNKGSIQLDIGSGYIMDDYIMSKKLLLDNSNKQ